MTPHAPTISRFLARAGFDRAESESTSIHGYRRRYPGFVVKVEDDHVRVEHSTSDSNDLRGPNDPPRRPRAEVEREWLAKYEEALVAAGYKVEQWHQLHSNGHSSLWVIR